MLSNEDREQINSVSTRIIKKYFLRECSPELFLNMEHELTDAIESILKRKVLIVCYEYGLYPMVNVVRAEVHYKDGECCISAFEVICDQEEEKGKE